MEQFLQKFKFNQALRGALGIEREFFLCREDGSFAPESPAFLKAMKSERWTYELSACQAEQHTDPSKNLSMIEKDLRREQHQAERIARLLNLVLTVKEVAPADIPLDVYPDEPRYVRIVKHLPIEVLRAACQVTGTHVHLGVGSIEEAIAVHNRLREKLNEFIKIGDHSNGERIRLYRVVAKHAEPPHYESVEHFYRIACEQGFDQNPRDCWHMIRISRHGSVEVRAFGMTNDVHKTLEWAKTVREVGQLA